MLRNKSIAVKFFLGFFLTSAIAILLMMAVVYFAVKNHVINTRVDRLEIIHNIKVKQLQNAVHYMENPILRFLKTNSDAYGLDKLFNAYNNLSNGISSETVEVCRNELSKQYAGQYNNKPILNYLNISSNYAVPVSNSGIIAQCMDLMEKIGIESMKYINYNEPFIKKYKELSEYFSNTFSLIFSPFYNTKNPFHPT